MTSNSDPLLEVLHMNCLNHNSFYCRFIPILASKTTVLLVFAYCVTDIEDTHTNY